MHTVETQQRVCQQRDQTDLRAAPHLLCSRVIQEEEVSV